MDEKQQQQPGPGTAEEIANLYVQQGMALSAITQQTGVPYAKLRQILEGQGVQIRGRGSYALRGSDHPSSKLRDEDYTDLVSELLAGRRHGELSRRFEISRERVRQIAQKVGAPSGRELQEMRRQAREKAKQEKQERRRELRRQERAKKYRLWREMWAEGLTVKEMADELDQSPGAVSVRIVNLRKEHPDWFPLRRKPRE